MGDDPAWRNIREVETENGQLLEVPLATAELAGTWLPIAGGNYLRQIPDFLMRHLVERNIQNESHPFVMYFQAWELDPEQPKLSVADRITKVRHYRKLEKYQRILPQYLQRYSFTSVQKWLGLPASVVRRHPINYFARKSLLSSRRTE